MTDKAELMELLCRVEEFCDQRADMRDSDRGPRPNEAAVLLSDVRELIADLEHVSGTSGCGVEGHANQTVPEILGTSSESPGRGVQSGDSPVKPTGSERELAQSQVAGIKPGHPLVPPDDVSSIDEPGFRTAELNPSAADGGHPLGSSVVPDAVSLPARMPAAGSGLSSGGAPTSLAGIAPDYTEGAEAAEYVKGRWAGAPVSLLVLAPSDLRPGDVIVYGSGQTFDVGRIIPWGSDGSYIVFPSHAGGGWVAHGHERLSVRRVAVSA